MLKGHKAQGIHMQAIWPRDQLLGPEETSPLPPWLAAQGTLQLPPQGSRWSSLFRPVPATPVYTLCSGLTSLVCNPLPLPTGLW